MDVCESEQALRKHRGVEISRVHLVSAEKNNATPTRRSATREVSSRYKSPTPTPASPSHTRRCLSPNLTRSTTPTSSKLLPKRPLSAERKRPATPPSPPSASTPVHDSSVDVHLSSRRLTGSHLPEGLWPSTMRSLSVSFQSDTVSVPISKKEKPVTSASDRTLLANSNVAHKQVETRNVRKPTPERKRSPLKGKNDSVSASPSDKTGLTIAGVRSLSLSSTGSCLRSPSKTSVLSSSISRVVSPARSRPVTPPSRGVSPSRSRPTSSSGQSNNPISVLSFTSDVKKGKKGAAYIEDAHQLRLLYNRHLQWRFANARAEDVLYIQNAIVERTLYNVWITALSIWESIIRKRINLQQLQLELKLNSILNDQMAFLDDWAVCESDHVDALSGAVEDLETNTLRLPVTGGAKVDIEDLKVTICSAVDIMQAMGSAICPLLSRVEGMDNLIFDVAIVSAQEKAMLDECEALLTSAAAMQVEENSLRTHLMQTKQALEGNK